MHDVSDRRPAARSVRETVSFRLSAEVLDRLDARASLLGTTRTTLAEQYLEEGLRLVEHPGIQFRDGPTGRRAGIVGGLDVWELVQTIRYNGGRLEDAAAYHGIALRDVQAAARYYAAFPDEIEARLRANEALADREAELAEAQRRLLG
jgi:uncharacterized protein (DUF433 family)